MVPYTDHLYNRTKNSFFSHFQKSNRRSITIFFFYCLKKMDIYSSDLLISTRAHIWLPAGRNCTYSLKFLPLEIALTLSFLWKLHLLFPSFGNCTYFLLPLEIALTFSFLWKMHLLFPSFGNCTYFLLPLEIALTLSFLWKLHLLFPSFGISTYFFLPLEIPLTFFFIFFLLFPPSFQKFFINLFQLCFAL